MKWVANTSRWHTREELIKAGYTAPERGIYGGEVYEEIPMKDISVGVLESWDGGYDIKFYQIAVKMSVGNPIIVDKRYFTPYIGDLDQ